MTSPRTILIGACFSAFALTVEADPPPGPRTYGIECPLVCSGAFDSPFPSGDTANVLNEFAESRTPPMRPGDKIVICNKTTCIIYQIIDNGWFAPGVEWRRSGSGGSASGGSGGGGGTLGGIRVIGIVTIGSVRPA